MGVEHSRLWRRIRRLRGLGLGHQHLGPNLFNYKDFQEFKDSGSPLHGGSIADHYKKLFYEVSDYIA